MNNAKMVTTSVEITSGDAIFRVAASKIAEKGFYHVIKLLSSKEDKSSSLPAMKEGEDLNVENFHPEQHFTQGPARYTDASIVRTLEEKGIGRPSTYAPIISVLLDRYYITRSNKQLVPTQLGRIICKILVESFPEVINEQFTADVENDLDKIEQNELVWNGMIADFFGPFKKKLDEGTAFEILSIDVADIDIGRNVGAKLQAQRAEADVQIANARAEERRAMAIAAEQEMKAKTQEMKAKLVSAQAELPKAISMAFKSGNIGVMDYYRMQNIQSDTYMRNSIGDSKGGNNEDKI
jgi:hypothetical protein